MANSPEWITLAGVKETFAKCGLAGADLVRMLAWAGAWRELVSTGFQQLVVDGEVANSSKREQVSSRLWRYLQYSFHNGGNPFGARATILEADWDWSSVSYRIERGDDDPRPPQDVRCSINWNDGSAYYQLENVEEIWRSILFDAPMITVLARQRASAIKRTRASKFNWNDFDSEVFDLLGQHGLYGANEEWTQAACERSMLTWCFHTWNSEPAESTIRKRLTEARSKFLAVTQAE